MDDRQSAQQVEFVIDQFGKVWVNVDGKCVLRIGRVDQVSTDDPVHGYKSVHGFKSDAEQAE